jgi:hypothetical protein
VQDDRGGAGVGSRLSALPPRWLAAGGAVVVLAISGLFGGLDRVDAGGVPTVAVGAVDRGEPWNVTVTGVRLLADQPPLHASRPGDRWLAVVATVEVTADGSRGDVADILRVSGAQGLRDEAPETVLLVRDYTPAQLHPGLPEKVAFFWEQAPDAPVPTQVTVGIVGKTHRIDTLTGAREWLEAAVRAKVRAPVEDRRS